MNNWENGFHISVNEHKVTQLRDNHPILIDEMVEGYKLFDFSV